MKYYFLKLAMTAVDFFFYVKMNNRNPLFPELKRCFLVGLLLLLLITNN